MKVVDTGSLSAAARAMHLSPSAVSKQLARLEERLAVPLLRRSTRQVQLTDAGRSYYDHCRRILSEVRAMEDALVEIQQEPRGRVRLSLSPGLAYTRLVPILDRLLHRHPALILDLHMSDQFVDVIGDDVDVALRIASLEDSSLVARRLASQVRLICAAPAYLARHGTPMSPQELDAHNCLTVSVQDSLNRWDFVGPDGPYALPVRGAFRASDMFAVYSAGLAGLGVMRISNLIAAGALASGALVPVLVEHTASQPVPLHVVTAGRKMSAAVRAVIDFLTEVFAVDAATPEAE